MGYSNSRNVLGSQSKMIPKIALAKEKSTMDRDPGPFVLLIVLYSQFGLLFLIDTEMGTVAPIPKYIHNSYSLAKN